MALHDVDEQLRVRIFQGMTVRLSSLGVIWCGTLLLPRESAFNWAFVGIAIGFFAVTMALLVYASRQPIEAHYGLVLVTLSNLASVGAIMAVYVERGEANNPAILLFCVPVVYEAVARRGTLYLAIPLVLSIIGFAACGVYLDRSPGDVATDTYLLGGFIVVLFLLVSFLVDQVQATATTASAVSRIAAQVAEAPNAESALAAAKADILLFTGATRVYLSEPSRGAHHNGYGSISSVVLPSTGRRLVFEGNVEHVHRETVGSLFDVLEQRQLMVNELQLHSTTDALTGLGNRRALQRVRTEEATETTVVMVDLDHFKQYNDLHGHGAGDDLLVDFGAALASCIRAEDDLFRYGGEEFCLILRCGVERAETVTRRVREVWEERASSVTFSAGIAPADGLEEIEQAIDRADMALYESKRAGRNKTTLIGTGEEVTPQTKV